MGKVFLLHPNHWHARLARSLREGIDSNNHLIRFKRVRLLGKEAGLHIDD